MRGGSRVSAFPGGGYAAVRYGVDLGAERVIGIGAPTTLERDFIWRMGAGRAVINRLERYIPEMMVDLRPFLENNSGAPRLDLYFGEDMGRDRAYAERLIDLPNVYLHPISGFPGHDVSAQLLRSGQLATILSDLCSESGST